MRHDTRKRGDRVEELVRGEWIDITAEYNSRWCPDWDWADLRWCMGCDEVRGKRAMEFTPDGRYLCCICVRGMAHV